MKKIFAMLLLLTFLFTGCGGGNEPAQKTDGGNSESKLIGVSMPEPSTGRRWLKEGETIKNLLEQKGYAVDLEFPITTLINKFLSSTQ